MRLAILAAIFVLSFGFGRTAQASSDTEGGPVRVDFRLDASEHKAPLASGQIELEPFQTSAFQATQNDGVKDLEVGLFARPQKDGTVAIELDFKEVDADGRVIRWRPALRGKRGVPLTATIHAGDISRTVSITLR